VRLPGLGLDAAAGGDEVLWQLVLAPIIQPASRLESLRVLEKVRVTPSSYAAAKRRLPAYAREVPAGAVSGTREGWTRQPGALRRQHAVFGHRCGDRSRKPGFTEERRQEPQITIKPLTGQDGFR